MYQLEYRQKLDPAAAAHQGCRSSPIAAPGTDGAHGQGPLQPPGHAYAAAVPAFVSAALAGEPVTIHGDGLQSRDFTYVGTVCSVIAEAIDRGITCGSPVNLASGTRVTLLEVVDARARG